MSAAAKAANRRLARWARGLEPELGRKIIDGWKTMRAIMDPSDITAILLSGSPERVISAIVSDEALRVAFGPLQSAITGGAVDAAAQTASFMPTIAMRGAVSPGIDLLNPRVLDGLRALEGRALGRLKGGLRDTLRDQIRTGLLEGHGRAKIARNIRKTVGMAPNQARAVANFERMLREGDAEALTRVLRDRRFDRTLFKALGRGGTGLSAGQVTRMTDAYRKRMIAFNASTQARSIALDSYRQGQHLSWEDAFKKGVADKSLMVKIWHNSGDDRVRPQHDEMEGEQVGFDEEFSNGEVVPGEATYNCRCGAEYRQMSNRTQAAIRRNGKGPRTGPSLRQIASKKAEAIRQAQLAVKSAPRAAPPASGAGTGVPFNKDPWADPRFLNAPKPPVRGPADLARIEAALSAEGRLIKEKGFKFGEFYHVTGEDAVEGIRKRGLVPAASGPLSQDFAALHSRYATYFHQSLAVAERDALATGGRVVRVRIRLDVTTIRRFLPDEDAFLDIARGIDAITGGGPVAFIGGVPKSAIQFLPRAIVRRVPKGRPSIRTLLDTKGPSALTPVHQQALRDLKATYDSSGGGKPLGPGGISKGAWTIDLDTRTGRALVKAGVVEELEAAAGNIMFRLTTEGIKHAITLETIPVVPVVKVAKKVAKAAKKAKRASDKFVPLRTQLTEAVDAHLLADRKRRELFQLTNINDRSPAGIQRLVDLDDARIVVRRLEAEASAIARLIQRTGIFWENEFELKILQKAGLVRPKARMSRVRPMTEKTFKTQQVGSIDLRDRKGLEGFNSMVDKKWLVGKEIERKKLSSSFYDAGQVTSAERVIFVRGRVNRAFYADINITNSFAISHPEQVPMVSGSVFSTSYGESAVVVHELGHHLETMSEPLRLAARKFLKRRWKAAGTKKRHLNDLTGSTSYDPWEFANEDDFFSPYVGKIYDNHTEVISMGLEYMYRDSAAFFVKDPDHYNFILDIMNGIVPS